MLRRFVLWLCKVTDIHPEIATERLMGGKDAVERGARWEMFYQEQGGLRDMLDGLRREAFEAASEIDPRETQLIAYWAMADRNIRRLQQRIEQVIITGKVKVAEAEQAERNAALRLVRSEF